MAKALEAGYRHPDTAAAYGVQDAVGKATIESGIPSKDIYDHARVPEAIESSLRKLGTEYVDLWLMYWPCAMGEDGQRVNTITPLETWLKMEKVLKER